MTEHFDAAKALRARFNGEWSNRHLKAFGPLLPSAAMDAMRILGQDGSAGAMVLRRLLVLIHQDHETLADAPGIICAAEPTLQAQCAALVSAIMDQDDGADLLPVDNQYDPENWDAIRSARLFIEHGV